MVLFIYIFSIFFYKTWLMVAVTLLSMIGMTTLWALVIYGRFNREFVTETVGEKIVYVIGIVANQGRYVMSI